jgi:hypothetical protein
VSEGGVAVFATCACLMPCAVVGSSNVVDIFNVTAGAWSIAALSQARWSLQPRRCRMPESRSSLVAVVRVVMSLFGVLRDGYGCEGDA